MPCLAALALTVVPATAGTASGQAPPAAAPQPVLEVFVRDGCPHCAEAKTFIGKLQKERPDLRLVYREVDRDPSALADLVERSQRAGISPPGVPTFAVGERLLVGFDDAESSGPAVRAFLDEASPPVGRVDTALLGTLSASRLGLPLFTLALGLLDGFNPCAMWVLLFLLSLLVRLEDRRRMALVAGTFVLVSGVVYYAFMAAWLNAFIAIGMSDALRWVLAGVALAIGAVNVRDALSPSAEFTLAIPVSAKPGLYARMRRVMNGDALPASLAAVAALAVVVNFVEFLCTAGLPAIYTAVLAQQHLAAASHYAYLALYIAGYIADDTLMVATAVIALGSRKLTARAGHGLKMLSGVVMLGLGTVLLLRPGWLA